MGTREAYEHGAFCWVDLETADIANAVAFYSGLFGWRRQGDLLTLGHDVVAGINPGPGNVWHSYVAVDDPQRVSAKAAVLGARVHLDGTHLTDPQGASFRLWAVGGPPGATRVNDPGCLVWNELSTTGPAEATRFYCELFGWVADGGYEGPDGPYTMLRVGNWLNAGVNEVPARQASWLPYFCVESVDETLARAAATGAELILPPVKTVIDRFTILRDPQGAHFAIVEGETDP